MRKIIITVVVACIFLMTGCSVSNQEVEYIEESAQSIYGTPTFKFTGESEHFSFATGQAYYDGNKRELLITNFKMKKDVKDVDEVEEYLVNVTFHDNSLFSEEKSKVDNNFKQQLEKTNISEYGTVSNDNYGESDAFFNTEESEFKSAIEVTVSYCYKNSKCEEEKMKLNFLEE